MCLKVYLASSVPLPPVEWNDERPSFHTRPLHERDEIVRRHFTLPHVVSAGSQMGCGCGFAKEGLADDGPEARQANYDDLAQWLMRWLPSGERVEIFACEDGWQSEPPELIDELTIEALAAPSFEFQEKRLVRVPGTCA